MSTQQVALRPFAQIADLYDDKEDDSFEIWKDADIVKELRLTLGQCRVARAALSSQPAEAPAGQGEPVYQRRSSELKRWTDVSKDEHDHILQKYGQDHVRVLYAALAQPVQAPAVPEWASVEDRLPPPGTDVLVRMLRYGNHEKYTVAALFHGEWASCETECETKGEVTHWMRLPAAPGRRYVSRERGMSRVTLTMTIDQAAAVTRLLDLATRIHLCQFGEIEHLARTGEIKGSAGEKLDSDELDELKHMTNLLGCVFGFSPNASFGIGSPHVSPDAHRGYEIKKVLEKALAEHRDPNPIGLRGVNYDGLTFRVTSDPAPVAAIIATSTNQPDQARD